jgi:hypothetical protein
LVPTSDGGDDLIGIGGPNKRLGAVVGSGEEAFDRGLEIDERSEHAALQMYQSSEREIVSKKLLSL